MHKVFSTEKLTFIKYNSHEDGTKKMIWQTPEWVLLIITCMAFFACLEIGFRIGKKTSTNNGRDEQLFDHVKAMQSALLGLLALLLGFTFSMAISRFDHRARLVQAEANAIGTAYIRADFISPAARQEVQKIFPSYVDSRLEFYNAGIDRTLLKAASEKSEGIFNRLWDISVAEAQKSPKTEITSLYIEALNEMSDINNQRIAAFKNHVPESVIYLLFVTAAVSIGFLGYGCGINGKRIIKPNLLMIFTIAFALTIVLDIDRPRRGLIHVDQSAMLEISKKIKGEN